MLYDIAAFGTSLTYLYRWQPELTRLLANAGKETRIYSSAINGGASDSGLTNVGTIVRLKPKAVFMEFSMNDCASFSLATAQVNTISLINTLKTVIPANRIYLMTMNRPVGSGSDAIARASVPTYYQNYRDLAASQGVRLIDIEPVWVSQYIPGDIPDGLHPSEASSKRITAPTIAARLIADLA